MKDTNNKILGFTDLPWKAIQEVTKRLQENKDYNGGKYTRTNHLNPLVNTEMLDAIIRHWLAYVGGEEMDPGTQSSHLTAIATNALLMEEQRLNKSLIENRIAIPAQK